MKYLFKRLNLLSLVCANNRWGGKALFLFSFADASFLPMPTSTFFLFLTCLARQKVFKFILVATLGTLAGAIAGYIAGFLVSTGKVSETNEFGRFLLSGLPGFSEDNFQRIRTLFERWNILILFFASATPIPYGFFSIASGAFGINLFVFTLITFISHGIRFLAIALVSTKFIPLVRRSRLTKFKPAAIITSMFRNSFNNMKG